MTLTAQPGPVSASKKILAADVSPLKLLGIFGSAMLTPTWCAIAFTHSGMDGTVAKLIIRLSGGCVLAFPRAELSALAVQNRKFFFAPLAKGFSPVPAFVPGDSPFGGTVGQIEIPDPFLGSPHALLGTVSPPALSFPAWRTVKTRITNFAG